MSDWLKREQVVAALKDAQMAPPYQDRGIMAKDAVKLFLMALAALDAEENRRVQPDTLEWQPIKTAPKDFTSVILTNIDSERMERAFFNTERNEWQDKYFDRVCFEPTHWLPLPESPSHRAQKDGKP